MRKIGADVGCSFVKLAMFDNNNNLIKHAVRSVAVRGNGIKSLLGGQSVAYLCDGQEWHIVDSSPNAAPTDFDEYPYSNLNAVLLKHAIKDAGVLNDEISIAASLPLNDYFNNEEQSKEKKNRVIAKPVYCLNKDTPVLTTPGRIIPEAVAGFIDMFYGFDGKLKEGAPGGDVGLVDIGGRTTDLCVIRGLDVYTGTVTTLKRGYLNVCQDLNKLINVHYPATGEFSITDLDRALISRKMEIETGRVEDVDVLVQQAIAMFTEATLNDINRILGNHGQLSGTCFFGGGVKHMEQIIKQQKGVYIPADPQFCNAVGNLKSFRI